MNQQQQQQEEAREETNERRKMKKNNKHSWQAASSEMVFLERRDGFSSAAELSCRGKVLRVGEKRVQHFSVQECNTRSRQQEQAVETARMEAVRVGIVFETGEVPQHCLFR